MLIAALNKQDVINATDQCVMCGLCLPHCPTYMIANNEAESPRGRIALVRAVVEDKLEITPTLTKHLDSCLTCMSCADVCPANVDYEKILDVGRELIQDQHSLSYKTKRLVLVSTLTNHRIRYYAKQLLCLYNKLGLNTLFSSFYRKSPLNLRIFNLIPALNKTIASCSTFNTSSVLNRVVLISSCASDLFSDNTKSSAIKLLQKLHCDVIEKAPAQCCGALHQHSGDLKKASQLIQNLSTSLIDEEYDTLISFTTGCGARLNNHPNLFEKLFDINTYVLSRLTNQPLHFKPLNKKVFVHKPCTQKSVTQNQYEVEQLLQKIPDIQLEIFTDELTCCGAGGLNIVTQAKLANALIANKISELDTSDASYLVTSNIGCALHFQANLHQDNNITVCHPITLLAQQLL